MKSKTLISNEGLFPKVLTDFLCCYFIEINDRFSRVNRDLFQSDEAFKFSE